MIKWGVNVWISEQTWTRSYVPTLMLLVKLKEEPLHSPGVKVTVKSEQMSSLAGLTQKVFSSFLHGTTERLFGVDIEELMSQSLP